MFIEINNGEVGQSIKGKTIYTIKQDSKNRIWFGTIDGMIGYIDQTMFNGGSTKVKNIISELTFNVIKLPKTLERYYKNYTCL